jgi:acetyltransferase-like isoleucine patch superfamily enzyme
MIEELPTRARPQLEQAASGGAPKLLAIRAIQYLTNYVVSHIPSHTVRRAWYRRVLGAEVGEHAGVHLGCHVWFYSPRQVRRSGFRVGAYSRVNRDCCLDVRGGLDIGENVSISPEVMILTASHGVNDPAFRVQVRPVMIEDHVWIGSRAMVLPGVTLGRGCVVAAGSVVTRDVAPLSIVAGVPARPVSERDESATHYVLNVPFPLFE